MAYRREQPRGIALLLVVAALALVSSLSYAMLSGATLQNRTGANQSRLATAEYLAESGLNLALYYLQYPDLAPSKNAAGYWGGTGGELAIAGDIAGTVNVTITQDPSDTWSYEVVCVATAGSQSSTQVTKTTGARVYVRNEFVSNHAALFNHNTTVPAGVTVNGDIWSSKSFGVKSGSTVTGTAYCKTPVMGSGYTSPLGGWKTVINPSSPSPSGTSELNLYQTYSIDDVEYNCAAVTNNNIGGATLNPTESNPAGVLYRSGALELQSDTIINGTLVVQGNLTIKGHNVVITPQPGFPALIVTGTLEIYQPKNDLTVNGLCYVGVSVRSNGISAVPAETSKFTVDGSLLLGTTGATNFSGVFPYSYNLITLIKHNPTKAAAPELTPVQRVAKGVSIVRWGLP